MLKSLKSLDPALRGVAAAALLSGMILTGAAPGFAQTQAPSPGGATAPMPAQSQPTQHQPAPPMPTAQAPAVQNQSGNDQAAAPTAKAGRAAARHSPQQVERRIAQLHRQLKITPEQEQQWNAVAQAMRDNAENMRSMIEQRMQNMSSMTAVDDLKSYEQLAQAHVDDLNKLIPAFDALYSSLSPEQQKLADAAFNHREAQHHTRHAKPKSQG